MNNEGTLTPREAYERMMNGESTNVGSKFHSSFSRLLLRRQAERLVGEVWIEGPVFSDDDANPWWVSITLRDGMLPRSAQTTLAAMRSNAHRTETQMHGKEMTVTFFVYCFETDGE